MLGGVSGALKGLSKVDNPVKTNQGRRTLKKGMSGMDVARCQNLLNRELAFLPPPLWVDGIFGMLTDRRVREFQVKRRLAVDGIVGPQTWSALEGKPIGGGGGGGLKGQGGGGLRGDPSGGTSTQPMYGGGLRG
jgi:hypothetical protein